jgi:hypothetical protein
VDPAYVSALFGLGGVTIGGLTSFLTTWLTQTSQLRDRHLESEKTRRYDLFNNFIVEASRLYADALSHEKDDVSDLVQLYAMVAKMRLLASRAVIVAAEQVMDTIIKTYLEPNRTLHEMRSLAQRGGMNFLLEFGEVARRELETDKQR